MGVWRWGGTQCGRSFAWDRLDLMAIPNPDVAQLLEGDVDRAYLAKWSETLGIAHLLREMSDE